MWWSFPHLGAPFSATLGRRSLRQTQSLRWALFTAIALLSCLVTSQATAAGFECQTKTDRSPGKIIVPFGVPELPSLPDVAVRILPGEVLCVSGRVDEAGDLVDLRLVEDARGVDQPVIRFRMTRASTTQLWVRHSSSDSLYYSAMRLVSHQDVAMPTTTLPVGPGERTVELWDRQVRKLLLFRFSFAEQQPPIGEPAPTPRKRAHGVNFSGTFGVSGGERWARLDGLNDALVRDGFAPLPHVGAGMGFEFGFRVWRIRFGVGFEGSWRSTTHHETDAELSTGLDETTLMAGFDVIRHDQLAVFISSGFVSGTLDVDARTEGLTLFRDLEPWEGRRVDFSYGAWPLELGTDQFFPLGTATANQRLVLWLGLRLGWVEQLDAGGWSTQGEARDARDLSGPAVDLSGPRGRLLFGIGFQTGR